MSDADPPGRTQAQLPCPWVVGDKAILFYTAVAHTALWSVFHGLHGPLRVQKMAVTSPRHAWLLGKARFLLPRPHLTTAG